MTLGSNPRVVLNSGHLAMVSPWLAMVSPWLSFSPFKHFEALWTDCLICQGSSNSYAIKKKDELERVAKANR